MIVEPVPSLVTVHLWGVPAHQVPTAVLRMALDRTSVRAAPGASFSKLLGTAHGRTFALRDTDPLHWAVLIAWDNDEAAAEFESSRTVRAWDAISRESLRVRMRPVSSRGTWSGRTPFGEPEPRRTTGPVAVVTRARIKPTLWRTFRAAVPPVATDLHGREGLVLAVGVGESPVGLQGTFSLWSDADAVRAFAHQGAAHSAAISATSRIGWYSEELFARFEVERAKGTYAGIRVDLGRPGPS